VGFQPIVVLSTPSARGTRSFGAGQSLYRRADRACDADRPIAQDVRGQTYEQEIYFAPPENLNDPMEGYKDVFWSGDLIAWRNLLRHYLL
jgi:hypothetical protein